MRVCGRVEVDVGMETQRETPLHQPERGSDIGAALLGDYLWVGKPGLEA